ncbi:pyridoxamine 5'-phosphate oxidase family protein [Nocardia yunnanensis]|uniref:Pyridoxamine 5'-phosphate oxidase family protein n=1 Tax=Nocardia yunnanensis TaxID=2382165 RepID=A0A386ZB98_9NOCA|nr:pyridoxamine 5'-phosphate oxidase family protein [Nocardia yunnanensis]AYF74900.1 pyridoxamine 5'-phosphate oxidase family protein [Nocardia yunnanensis]
MIPIEDNRPRRTVDLTTEEAWKLLGAATFGRVVYTQHALPAIRPVNHLVDDGMIIIRNRLSSRFTTSVYESETVVAFEADSIDPIRHTGWAVIVTGIARPVEDPDHCLRYGRQLQPWVDKATDTLIAIEPTIVTGIRLLDETHPS